MQRKLYLTLFLLIISMFSVLAQSSQTEVTGNVEDKGGEPLPGCTVLFLQEDTIAGYTTTDIKGRFAIKGLPAGDYECKVSMIGYDPASQTFTLSGKVKLPKFVLEESSTVLEELTVLGGARSKELAGMSIYYLSDRAKKENDAYYALQEIPRLIVNPLGRSIKIDDGSTPLILVNGVKKPLDVISPEMIESVEIIDNPSARYRGDTSVSSVLNIKLKKDGTKPYLRGNVLAKATPNLNSLYSNASFELGSETTSLYLTGGYMQNSNMRSVSYSDTYQGNLHRIENTYNKTIWRNPYVFLGGDKMLSKKNYIAVDIRYLPTLSSETSTTEGQISDISIGESSPLTSEVYNRNRYHQLVANLYYKHTFKDTRILEVTGNYYYTMNGVKTHREENSFLYNYISSIDLDNHRHMGEMDVNYSDMLNKSLHLEVGSKTEYSVTDIDDFLDPWPDFRYRRTREYVYAGIDNNRASGSKFNYSLSLGLDMVFSDAAGVRHSYIDFVPSVSFRYKFDTKNSLSLQYDRTRTMPNAAQLNPLNTSTDSLRVNMGNPLLTPSHTDKVRLGYTFRSRGFRVNPYVQYSLMSKRIQPYGYMDGEIYINTYQNFGHMSWLQAGTTFSYAIPQGKPYYGNTSISVYYLKNYIKGMPFSGDVVSCSFNANFGYKRVSAWIYLGLNNYSYSLYTKSRNTISSNIQLDWRVIDSVSLALFAEKFLWPKMNSESWTINGDYYSYNKRHKTTLTWKARVQANARKGSILLP